MRSLTFALPAFIFGFVLVAVYSVDAEDNPKKNDAAPPLKPLAFQPLPLGSIRPAGWLKQQLQIQANGLSGHLDEFWPDLTDSAWLGGKREGWERGPYWLDGIVPLAYVLDDEKLKGKVSHWMNYILLHQHEDGWLGPRENKGGPALDPWPLYVLFKAMTQVYEATGDKRIIPAMQKCMKRLDALLDKKPLESWGHYRWADLVLSIHWLYEQTKDKALLDLAVKVHKQGFDWREHFADFKITDKVSKMNLGTHGVNTGMALKTAGIWYRQSGDEADKQAIYQALKVLDKYHGQANGIFTCDEHLAGKNPSQGTELCTVVEAQYSLEILESVLGDPLLADRLERITFNALPAPFKPDMCAHQYDQQANQVVCKISDPRVYTDNGPDANTFGVEPNFGCCTANMHQGWPKFTTHLWMRSPDGGLAAIAYAPCIINTEIDGKKVQIEVQTGYPFDDTIKVVVLTKEAFKFPLYLRIPGWSEKGEIRITNFKDGLAVSKAYDPEIKPGQFHRINRKWEDRTEIALKLPMQPKVRRGYHDSVSLERGPLVYALRVDADWRLLKGNPPFGDWEVFPKSPWNYGLELDLNHPENSVEFTKGEVGDRPFSPEGAPIIAKVKGRKLPGWKLEKNAAGPPPASPVKSTEPLEELILIPYGCTTLRVTEFPLLEK